MANTVLFVLFVFLLSRAALSLPVKDINSVQSSRTIVFVRGTILRRLADIEKVKSFNSGPVDFGVKRTKRQIIVGNGSCAQGMRWIGNHSKCVTQKQYDELNEDSDVEIVTTTLSPQTTPRSPSTRRPLTKPSPRSTLRPPTTPLAPNPPMTASVSTTPQPPTTTPTTTSLPKSIGLSSSSGLRVPVFGQLESLFYVLLFITIRSHCVFL